MKAMLLRTGSNPVHNPNRTACGSPTRSPRLSMPPSPKAGTISFRRSNSDSDIIRFGSTTTRLNRTDSVSLLDMSSISEEEREFDTVTDQWYGNGMGVGNGKGNPSKGGWNIGGNDEANKIGEYYKQMLKANPGDSLLLRNYAKYLHEVERNTEKAEEYYGRAILANPGDGELLSLYGKLIWETHNDEDRAKSYFDQAVQASPDDCMVLGSYASFLWETEEDEEDGQETKQQNAIAPPMVVGAY